MPFTLKSECTLDIYAAVVCWTCSLNRCTDSYVAYRKRTLHGIYI